MGMTNLRFKPAYNPYTEVCIYYFPPSISGFKLVPMLRMILLTQTCHIQPSLEIFAWHSHLEKWVEIGNSGMFRPEMLAPMGFPPNVRVHGWGIGLERPTMIR